MPAYLFLEYVPWYFKVCFAIPRIEIKRLSLEWADEPDLDWLRSQR